MKALSWRGIQKFTSEVSQPVRWSLSSLFWPFQMHGDWLTCNAITRPGSSLDMINKGKKLVHQSTFSSVNEHSYCIFHRALLWGIWFWFLCQCKVLNEHEHNVRQSQGIHCQTGKWKTCSFLSIIYVCLYFYLLMHHTLFVLSSWIQAKKLPDT